MLRLRASPVIDALRVDAQNDAVVGTVALIGFALGRAQLPAIDPVLAILVAIYVGVSSVRLARTSVSLLLGTSAPAERVAALRAVCAGTEGVRGVSRLVAITHGAALHVEAEVEVEGALRVDEAHRIAHAVEARLRAEPDVGHAMVHVGPRA
jgi:ferrous-iron efflux pump FieF